jgi:hypothetical protein
LNYVSGTNIVTLQSTGITDDIISNGCKFTLNAWVKPTTISGDDREIIYLTESSVIVLRIDTTGVVEGWVRQSDGINKYSTGTSILSLNTWYMLTFTSDGTNLKTYVNAVQDGSNTFDGTTQNTTLGNVLGNNYNQTNDFVGDMCYNSVWSTNLSQSEIQNLYKQTYRQ